MKEKTLKRYAYKIIIYKSEHIEHIKRMHVYAYDKKTADNIMFKYSLVCTCEYHYIRSTKVKPEVLEFYAQRYNGIDNFINVQYDAINRMRRIKR